jgi:hypothetical protein
MALQEMWNDKYGKFTKELLRHEEKYYQAMTVAR